jgi:5-oxoprolinase (ATP-hydrolysing)
MIKMTSRGISATVDAYLTPITKRYVEGFRDGFTDRLLGSSTQCEFMQSDGGLIHFEKYKNLIMASHNAAF